MTLSSAGLAPAKGVIPPARRPALPKYNLTALAGELEKIENHVQNAFACFAIAVFFNMLAPTPRVPENIFNI